MISFDYKLFTNFLVMEKVGKLSKVYDANNAERHISHYLPRIISFLFSKLNSIPGHIPQFLLYISNSLEYMMEIQEQEISLRPVIEGIHSSLYQYLCNFLAEILDKIVSGEFNELKPFLEIFPVLVTKSEKVPEFKTILSILKYRSFLSTNEYVKRIPFYLEKDSAIRDSNAKAFFLVDSSDEKEASLLNIKQYLLDPKLQPFEILAINCRIYSHYLDSKWNNDLGQEIALSCLSTCFMDNSLCQCLFPLRYISPPIHLKTLMPSSGLSIQKSSPIEGCHSLHPSRALSTDPIRTLLFFVKYRRYYS